jgi:hypothetical protein
MADKTSKTNLKPLFLTWRELLLATYPLHQMRKADVDRLHDVWKKGAPSPGSIVRNPKGYDERLAQAGNFEARLVFPKLLVKWVLETANAKGMNVTERDVRRMFRAQGVRM